MKSFPVYLLIAGLLAGVFGSTLAAGASTPASLQRQTSKLKGAIKSLDTTSAVVVPSQNKDTQITFRLTATTERTGALASGDSVEVVYYFDQGQRVATALVGKASAQ